MTDLNYRDLVHAIEQEKHRRRTTPDPAPRPHRTRHALARNLHRLAARLEH